MTSRFVKAASVVGISIVLLLAVVGLAYRTEIVSAAPPLADETVVPSITATGTGRVSVTPDQATINVGVQITAPTLEQATRQADEIMTSVLDAVKAQGVDPKEIQTSSYYVTPITTYQEGKEPLVTGYQVSNIVNVKVTDIDNVAQVLDAAMGAGANYLGGITFGVSNPAVYEEQARTAAVKDAMHIAETYAGAAGVGLGNVISMTEGVVNSPPHSICGRDGGRCGKRRTCPNGFTRNYDKCVDEVCY